MKTHLISKKDFNDFKNLKMKEINKSFKKSPSVLLACVATLYVNENNIDCDILGVGMGNGGFQMIPIDTKLVSQIIW